MARKQRRPRRPRRPQNHMKWELLALYAKWIDRNGFQPTYEEAAEELGYASKNSIAQLVRLLEQDGEVQSRRTHGQHRIVFLRNDWTHYFAG